MSKLNTQPRGFNTVFRQSSVLHPNFDSNNYPKVTDYIEVRTISTRGSWPVVHMIDEDTFVQMAVLAGHVQRKGTNRKGFRPS